MRIAIPTDDELTLAQHTGRCQGFAIYDIADGQARKLEYRRNTFTHHPHGHDDANCGHQHHHGEGHGMYSHAGLLEGLQDCGVVVAVGMGRRLIDDLEAKGLRVIFSREPRVTAAAEAFAAGLPIANPAGSSCHR